MKVAIAPRTAHARGVAALAFLAMVASCDGSRVAENQAERVESWQLSDAPVFRVPGFEIGEDSTFFGATGPIGTFTPDGDIVVAITDGDYRVVYADSLGSGITTLGGPGQGPGEFRRIKAVTLNGDTAAVWDWVNSRVSFFAHGEFAGVASLRLPRSRTYVGLLDDGTVVVTPQILVRNPVVAQRFLHDLISEGQARPYFLLNRSGESVDTLLGAPEPPSPVFDLMRAGEAGPRMKFMMSASCLPVAMHVAAGDRILVANSAEGRLYALERSGVMTPLFTSAHRATVRQELLERIEGVFESAESRLGPFTEESKQRVRERLGRPGDPLATVWSAVIRDVRGGVWLQQAPCDARWLSAPTTTWEVLGPTGKLNATVSVPRDVTLLSVDGDRVLASVFDEMETPYLAMYRIRR